MPIARQPPAVYATTDAFIDVDAAMIFSLRLSLSCRCCRCRQIRASAAGRFRLMPAADATRFHAAISPLPLRLLQ